MQTERHPLISRSAGSAREIVSHHFGSPENGRKVYIQASLHADEIPGMLVAHYLRQAFTLLEQQGQIQSEIVLVPVANPIGLAQDIQGSAFGRFDLATGINFNRAYHYLTPRLIEALEGKLTADAAQNVRLIRQQAKHVLLETPAHSETEQLKRLLQTLAIDADVVLDLHCDNQALMHLYTGTPLASTAAPLAQYLGARALLVSAVSGDDPFDESCSRHWWELAQHFGDATPIPPACAAITIELRGETDVNHQLAQQDAQAIIAYLQSLGHISGAVRALPEARCVATPLEGVDPILAEQAGILVFTKSLGDHVEKGEMVGDIVDPISGLNHPLVAQTSGILFARLARRYVHAGMRVAKIAGNVAFRSGNLLSL